MYQNKKKIALIFGVTGQDGSYLSKLLLSKYYKVYGVTRSKNLKNLKNLYKLEIHKKINLIEMSNFDKKNISKLISKITPNEIYFLAGQSSVSLSFQKPVSTYKSNNIILFYILEYCRNSKKKINIYNSASSECFGNNKKIICNERTPFNPISPYGNAKSFGFWLTKYYRENFKINASNGIVFNHESPLRKKYFVTQKIVNYVKNYNRKSKKLLIGNLNIFRDWGWANDYVEIMYKINISKKNDDYVIGSGKIYSLKKLLKIIFYEKKISFKMVKTSKKLFRPMEIKKISSNISKIKKEFKWKPKHNITLIAKKLVNSELY